MLARNNYSFEKRRKELDKKKKKEAKRLKKLERKAEGEASSGPPIAGLDEDSNPITVVEETVEPGEDPNA